MANDLGFLNNLGTSKASNTIEFDSVDAVFAEFATIFINRAKATINKKHKIDSGNLSDIVVSKVSKSKDSFSITIGYDKTNPASKYYDFVDKGVKGVKNGTKAPGSKYKYKTLSVGSKFTNVIMQWYLRHKNYIRQETQVYNLSRLQTKRKTLAQVSENDKIKSIAYLTAKKIKREGLQRVGFFADNVNNVFNDKFKARMAQAIGRDIVINIKDTLNGNNN